MLSLVQSLKTVGRSTPFSYKKNLHFPPDSLRKTLELITLPAPKLSNLKRRKVFDFTEENAQGIVFAKDDIWYLSSEMRIFKYSIKGPNLYTPSSISRINGVHLSSLISQTDLNPKEYDHIGDIDYCDGLIFASVRRREIIRIPSHPQFTFVKHTPPHLLLVLSESFNVVGYTSLPLDIGDSWCAINPRNKHLYMPNINNNSILNMFDISAYHQVFLDTSKWGKSVEISALTEQPFRFLQDNGSPDYPGSIQGIAFAPDGRLYVARYNNVWDGWENYLYVYSSLTGKRLDTSNEIDFPGTWDEIEGLSVHSSGVLYVAVADNDSPSDDEFEVHVFKYR